MGIVRPAVVARRSRPGVTTQERLVMDSQLMFSFRFEGCPRKLLDDLLDAGLRRACKKVGMNPFIRIEGGVDIEERKLTASDEPAESPKAQRRRRTSE